jgi:FkbM family methyltransferase
VQGVEMVLPWSHRLPDYARVESEYGQNLPRLAAALARADGTPVVALDIGANVGDSTLQILDATEGRVLCVEADDFYLDFLHRNVDGDARIAVEASLLLADDDDAPMAPVRSGGTTRFVPGESEKTAPMVSVTALRERHPDFAKLRLAKSDTDGYDVQLIPAVARAWADTRPVLFFEYDHELSRLAGNDPLRVWDELGELGYDLVRVWDNGGRPIGIHPLAEMAARSALLDEPLETRAYHFWDVAVAHRDDAAGAQALRDVRPE